MVVLTFLLCFAAVFPIVAAIERLAKPRTAAKPLSRRVRLLTIMPTIVLFLTFFMIGYRPILAMAGTGIAFGIVVVLNNSKYAVLREPLVFSDFSLLREAVRHPQLYVKHIGIFKIIGLCVVTIAAVSMALVFENPLLARPSLADYFPTLAYLFILFGLIYAITNGPLRRPMRDFLRQFGASTDVRQDMDQLSLVACLVVYFFLAKEPNAPAPSKAPVRKPRLAARRPSFVPASSVLPDIVAVQSESFFDARLVHGSIPRDLLGFFDETCARSAFHGRLSVPAWGANTMRTELAFLSGLPNEALGVHRFNPYLALRHRPIWTIAHQLRSAGYRTVCIHPFDQNFFDRDKVYPNLGFDLFLDIRAFAGAATFGPYVCDRAVADKVLEVLGKGDGRPRFVFAITMENHGKWEMDRLAGQASADDLVRNPPLGSVPFGCYLAHLRNTDALIDRLTQGLAARARPSVFALYGDHVPGLPEIFAQTGFEDPRTDYFIWRSGGKAGQRLDLDADTLGRLMLHAAFGLGRDEPPLVMRGRGKGRPMSRAAGGTNVVPLQPRAVARPGIDGASTP